MKRDVVWGGLLPTLALIGLIATLVTGAAAWLLLPAAYAALFLLNIVRIFIRKRRDGLPPSIARASALLLMVGKWAEFGGVLSFHWSRLRGRRAKLIEYKGATA